MLDGAKRLLHGQDIVSGEAAAELRIVDLAVAVEVGEVDEVIHGGVAHVVDVELQLLGGVG